MFLLFAAFYTGPEERPADEEEVLELVHEAQVGNARAARRLYALHVGRVFRAVRPLCGSEAEAEDVTHDTFVDALTHLPRFSPRPDARFVGWLLTLALNRARKRRARAGRAEKLPPEVLRPQHSAVDEGSSVRKQLLLKALGELPERDRQILSLRYGAELTADEVAKVVSVSSANVRKICERRRRALLERLGGPGQEVA
jgi:RNA polymerase sigma-70 factor, ECF subfamily